MALHSARNVFLPAMHPDSDGGERITKSEFLEVVAHLLVGTPRLTGAMVQRIRRDWESLSRSGKHPGTPSAHEAYRNFARRHGELVLLEMFRAAS